jgi:hypothetical protein
MVSRFAKPQIGQTSSDSRMGGFTANLEDGISADYTDYADYSVRVKQRDEPRRRDQAEGKCGDDPKCHSQALSSAGLSAGRSGITNSRRQIDAVKGECKKQQSRSDEKGPVRFEQA